MNSDHEHIAMLHQQKGPVSVLSILEWVDEIFGERRSERGAQQLVGSYRSAASARSIGLLALSMLKAPNEALNVSAPSSWTCVHYTRTVILHIGLLDPY